MIKAIRISKTSFKPWALYGPIDQALKTSIQAESVRVVSVTAPIGDVQMELELWIDASSDAAEHGPNVPATIILLIAHARENGLPNPIVTGDEGEMVIPVMDGTAIVHGPAIMTGAGGADIPEAHLECLIGVLLGAEG